MKEKTTIVNMKSNNEGRKNRHKQEEYLYEKKKQIDQNIKGLLLKIFIFRYFLSRL